MAKKKNEIKIIQIVSENNNITMKSDGFTDVEVLGLLRLYEQSMSVRILQSMQSPSISTK